MRKSLTAALVLLASLVALLASPALGDPVVDTRQIMAGSVSTTSAKNAYLSGARDGWNSFKGALSAYKAVRAAEVPPTALNVFELPVGVALANIASNFDTAASLIPSWGTGQIAASASPDVVGAFRFVCGAGQILRDDPIVYPGQAGASHLHQFFGNDGANANSTYASLRASGGSTCNNEIGGRAVNRSAYWMPAMLDGKGSVVKPDYVSVYYKRMAKSNPGCTYGGGLVGGPGDCVPLPNGLRFIAGYDMVTNTPKTGKAYFKCDGQTATGDHFENFADAKANCPTALNPDGSYNHIGAVIIMPDCWDGVNLDTPNHRSHMAYATDTHTDGSARCDTGHPKLVPTFTMGVWYTVDANLGTWSLSSDAMRPDLPVGSTFHADWFGAWDNGVEAMWMDNCINKLLNCSGGDLGNGKQIKGAQQPSYGWTNPTRLVPVP